MSLQDGKSPPGEGLGFLITGQPLQRFGEPVGRHGSLGRIGPALLLDRLQRLAGELFEAGPVALLLQMQQLRFIAADRCVRRRRWHRLRAARARRRERQPKR